MPAEPAPGVEPPATLPYSLDGALAAMERYDDDHLLRLIREQLAQTTNITNP